MWSLALLFGGAAAWGGVPARETGAGPSPFFRREHAIGVATRKQAVPGSNAAGPNMEYDVVGQQNGGAGASEVSTTGIVVEWGAAVTPLFAQRSRKEPALAALGPGSGEMKYQVGGIELGEPEFTPEGVPPLRLLGAPISGCLKRQGKSSVMVTADGCRRLGGVSSNKTAADDDQVFCLLDMCPDGRFSMVRPGRCGGPKVATTRLEMGKADCSDLFKGQASDPYGLVDRVDCMVDLCRELGAYFFRPAGTCNQPVWLGRTLVRDCNAMSGRTVPHSAAHTSHEWAEKCEMDVCEEGVSIMLEVVTRSVHEAMSETGAHFSFKVLGEWLPTQLLFNTADERQVISKKVLLESWPERMLIRAMGSDVWGFSEIRIQFNGATIWVLRDEAVSGSTNDVPNELSQYWVGAHSPAPMSVEFDVPYMNRVWRTFGNDLSCRLSESDSTEDGHNSVKVETAHSLTECTDVCEEEVESCYGVEYEGYTRRCELWFKPITFVRNFPGQQCYVYWSDAKLAFLGES